MTCWHCAAAFLLRDLFFEVALDGLREGSAARFRSSEVLALNHLRFNRGGPALGLSSRCERCRAGWEPLHPHLDVVDRYRLFAVLNFARSRIVAISQPHAICRH